MDLTYVSQRKRKALQYNQNAKASESSCLSQNVPIAMGELANNQRLTTCWFSEPYRRESSGVS